MLVVDGVRRPAVVALAELARRKGGIVLVAIRDGVGLRNGGVCRAKGVVEEDRRGGCYFAVLAKKLISFLDCVRETTYIQ